MREMNFSYEPQPIMTINNHIKKGLIELKPTFQRGYIWKNEFKDELIVSILSGYPIGNVIIYKSSKMEVVDGQQRLTTISNFIGDKLEFYEVRTKKSVFRIKEIIGKYFEKYKNILSDDELKSFTKLSNVNTIKFSDFPDLVKDDFMSYNLNVTYLTSSRRESIAEYFKYVQNQETLKAGEIINSMYLYNNELNQLTSKIEDKSTIIKILGINSKRYEFDKHFINFVGLLSGKIPLNATQTGIVNYAKDFSSADLPQNVLLLIDNLNLIPRYYVEKKLTFSLNARMLKVLFGFLSFYKLDEQDIDKLHKVLMFINNEHKKGNAEIINEITFIENSTKSYEDVEKSANNMRKMINNYV